MGINEGKERGGYGWNDASCSHKHESSDGKKIRNLEKQPCQARAALLDYRTSRATNGSSPTRASCTCSGQLAACSIQTCSRSYFVRKSATALIRKQLKVSEHAVLEHTAKREGENVSLSDVT